MIILINSCDGKAEYSAAVTSVSHDPSEIKWCSRNIYL